MRGLKTIRSGWKDPLHQPAYRPGGALRPSAEQIAENARKDDALMTRIFAEVGQRHPRIVDRQARVAVEGDTDLNHDNVEAAE